MGERIINHGVTVQFECDHCGVKVVFPGANVGQCRKQAKGSGWSLTTRYVWCPEHRTREGRKEDGGVVLEFKPKRLSKG